MLVDDKQAREMVERLQRIGSASTNSSYGVGTIGLCRDAALVIESLSAQVAALTKERDQYLHELEDAENQITGYWSRQKQRADAAEDQVAELKKNAERDRKDARLWRTLEHGCQWVSFQPIDGDRRSFDPRNITGYDGDLLSMRNFAGTVYERHLKNIHDAIDTAKESGAPKP